MFSCAKLSWRQLLWSLAWGTSAVAASYLIRRLGGESPWKPAFVLAPFLPGAMWMIALVDDMKRLDELQRRVWLEACAISVLGAFLFLTTAPLFYKAGYVREVTPEKLAIGLVGLVFVSWQVTSWRYR